MKEEIIGFYIYREGCKYSIKYAKPWEDFTNNTDIITRKFEVDSKYKKKTIGKIFNEKFDNLIDTKPCILFYNVDTDKIYLFATRPATKENLTDAKVYLENNNNNDNNNNTCIINPSYIITNPDRRKILSINYEKDPIINLFEFIGNEL